MKFDELINTFEEQVRSGRFDNVERALKRLNLRQLPRRHALPLANIARRVNNVHLALRILSPYVRVSNATVSPATPLELIEYAESLRKLGAVDEACRILEALDCTQYPQALLYRAFCCFPKWQYAKAIPLLRQFLTVSEVNSYMSLVAEVNLAAALVHQHLLDEAEVILERLRSQTRQQNLSLLYGNVLELSAQVEMQRERWKKVEEYLQAATDEHRRAGAIEQLWTKKWKAIADSLREGRVHQSLLTVKETALTTGHWETVRDCAFYQALISRDQNLMTHVYFGTPFGSYREKMQRMAGAWYCPPKELILTSSNGNGAIFDLATGTLDKREILVAGQVPFRFMSQLFADLYRPLPLVMAFATVFTDEHFNPRSSPARIHQTAKRLRRTFDEHGIDIEVLHAAGAYQFKLGAHLSVRLQLATVPESSRHHQLQKILNGRGNREFSIREVCQTLNASVATARRLVRWGLRERKLKTIGSGPQTRYRAAG